MGIIKDIIREAVIRNNGWVKLIKFLEPILGDRLLPHKIVGNVIQYDIDNYIPDPFYLGDYRLNNVISSLSQIFNHNYKFAEYLGSHIIMYKHKDDNHELHKKYIWFDFLGDMDYDGFMGSGQFKNTFKLRGFDDRVRKVYHGKEANVKNIDSYFSKDDILVKLSNEYPDLFFKTIRTKTGYIQDKVIKPLEYFDEYGEYNESILDDIKDLKDKVIEIFNNEYPDYRIDFHDANVGYDKDGKLKMFDI